MRFTRMDQGSDEDFQVLKRVHEQTLADLPDRLIAMVNDLSADAAYNLNRRGHSLQAATRALRCPGCAALPERALCTARGAVAES